MVGIKPDIASTLVLTRQAERELCKRSFSRLLSHVMLLDPPPEGKGIIPFEMWPHLQEIIRLLYDEQLLLWLKARQIGASWILASYALWVAQYQEAATVLMFSQGQQEAQDLLAKARFVHDHLPDYLRVALGVESKGEMTFPSMDSRILALPSTPGAGRSITATVVIMDEADYHEYLEENFAAVKPTIDTSGGQLILASTSNFASVDSTFKNLYRNAPDNGFTPVFFDWRVRPGRDDAWFERKKKEASDLARFEREYPNSAEAALAAPTTMRFFQMEPVEGILASCREPVEMRLGGLVRIWKPPVVAGKYIAGADTAWGQKGSYSCVVVADYVTGEQVAEIYGRPSSDELAQVMYDTFNQYNKAFLVCEANGENIQVINKLVALGYGPRMYHRGDGWRDDEKHRGFLTGEVTRPKILTELEEAVRLRGVTPVCRDAAKEMMTFIRPKDHPNHPEASKGSHDDHVMAWALLWFGHGVARWDSAAGVKPIYAKSSW